MLLGGWPSFSSIQGHRLYDCLVDLSFKVFGDPLIAQNVGDATDEVMYFIFLRDLSYYWCLNF